MRLAWLLLLGLAACNSDALHEGGSDGGDVADLGQPVCDGKTEAECTGGCVADYCQFCGCGQSFVGCRATTDAPKPCPALSCPAGICCWGLNETQCKASDATLGCTAVSCPDCDGKLTLYQGCFGPAMGAPACPALICPARCTHNADCRPNEFCQPPGSTWSESCLSDGDCGGGWCIDNGCYATRGTCESLGV